MSFVLVFLLQFKFYGGCSVLILFCWILSDVETFNFGLPCMFLLKWYFPHFSFSPFYLSYLYSCILLSCQCLWLYSLINISDYVFYFWERIRSSWDVLNEIHISAFHRFKMLNRSITHQDTEKKIEVLFWILYL